MLKLYDRNHNPFGEVFEYKNLKIKKELESGDKTLSFTLLQDRKLETEQYIHTETDEYVIKEIDSKTNEFSEIVCALNLEDLEREVWTKFEVAESTVDNAARTLLAGTGWTVGHCDVTKIRNAGMVDVNTREALQKLAIAFMCDIEFDTKNKKVNFYLERGEDKGVYFIEGLNLKKLNKKTSSYDFYTRIIPYGANGLTIESVNDGKIYLDNHQYSEKVLTYIWKDDSYTNAQALKEDAEEKLKFLSNPELSYSADILNLAKQNEMYGVLSYELGDKIRLVDKSTNTMDSQRIIKITEYPDDHTKDTCELANTFLTFEQMQEKVNAAAAIVNNTISSSGMISLSSILNFEAGIANSSTIQGINGELNRLGQLAINALTVDEADIRYANIKKLEAAEAKIKSIEADYIKVEDISAENGKFNYLDANTINSTYVHANLTESDKAAITEAIVQKMHAGGVIVTGDEHVTGEFVGVSVSANSIKAGTLDAGKVTIANLKAANIEVEYINGQKVTAETAINDVFKAVDDIEVGGRNLLRNSETLIFTDYVFDSVYLIDENGDSFVDIDGELLTY